MTVMIVSHYFGSSTVYVAANIHCCVSLDYGNFKLTNQVARNAGSIFHSHLVSGIYSWPLAPSTGIYLHACC